MYKKMQESRNRLNKSVTTMNVKEPILQINIKIIRPLKKENPVIKYL